MTSMDTTSSEFVKIIEQFYAGINRDDIDLVLNLISPNIIRVESQSFPGSGVYRGLSEFRKHLASGRSTWAEGGCEPVDFFQNDQKVVVIVHVKVRLKHSTDWIDAKIADGFSFHDGRVTEFNSYPTKEEAFVWAGMGDRQ